MDNLDDLPIDHRRKTSDDEMQVMQRYIKPSKKAKTKSLWDEIKIVLLATLLFLLMATDTFDKCLLFIPYTDSVAVKIGIKGLIFATALFVLTVLTS